MRTIDVYVTGRVQGVGYRYFVVRNANLFNIKGFTRNLSDGRVRVLACGDPGDLDLFLQKLKTGPSLAIVSDLEVTELEKAACYEDFRVEY